MLTAGFIALSLMAVPQSAPAQQGRSTCTQARPLLADAQTAITAGDSGAALKKLNQAVEIDPTCPDAHLLLGLTNFQRGEVAKSIEHYKAAIKLDPRSYSAHYDLALAYLKQKKLQLARTQLEHAVALDPKQANAAYDLGIVLLELGKPAAALRPLQRAHALTPDRPDVSFNLVRASLDASQLEDARRVAQEGSTHLSSDFQWNASIGQEFLKHAQPQDAVPYLRAANAARPADDGVRNQLATAYLASRQPENVLELIQEAKTAEDHYLRGSAFYQAHRFPDADAESDAALTLDPENPKVLVLRVRLLQRSGQQEAALEMAHKASGLAPNWDEPHYLAGISSYFLRHYAEAHQSLARAFELNPRSAVAIFMAALAAANEGKPREAEQYLRRAIALQPDNSRFRCHLGILLMRQTEYTEAEEALKKAAQLKPEYALPHYELGKLWVLSKQWKDASKEFESTIAADPGFTSAYYQLARVYAKLGETEKSERTLADFKKLHQKDQDDSAVVDEDARSASD
ncbi:MAG TPA: tetratricopeptide repeat protein [Terriglobales bacterium]|nr:tetratricopeptide repeat protein [Terriglobales bacterium]